MNKNKDWIFRLMVVVGILLLSTSAFLGYSRFKFLENAIKSEGIVVKYEGTLSSNSARIAKMMYAPVVSFNSSEGKSFEFESALSSNDKPYMLGERVTVVYDPSNPLNAEIYSFTRMWFLSLTVLFGSIVVSLIGIIGLKHPERISNHR